VQVSAATGGCHFPSGTGSRETQRFLFGYPERTDFQDKAGHQWRPGTEFVSRATNLVDVARPTNLVDTVAAFWWTRSVPGKIMGTTDPELYRYGIHCRDFWINATVGPGRYYVRLKLAATRGLDTVKNSFDIRINGEHVVKRLDVAATAGATNRAVDLVFNDIKPRNGIIEIRFTAAPTPASGEAARGEAFVQALEIGPGGGGKGAKAVSASQSGLN
jgi:hypothetical protein